MTTLGGLRAAERGKFGALVFVCVSAVALGAAVSLLRRVLVCSDCCASWQFLRWFQGGWRRCRRRWPAWRARTATTATTRTSRLGRTMAWVGGQRGGAAARRQDAGTAACFRTGGAGGASGGSGGAGAERWRALADRRRTDWDGSEPGLQLVPAASPAPHAGKRLWRARAEQVRAAVRSLPPLKRLRRRQCRWPADGRPRH